MASNGEWVTEELMWTVDINSSLTESPLDAMKDHITKKITN